jgi:hypothetical protein
MVDTSLVVKDNHRPHLAAPLDPAPALPPGNSGPPAGSSAPAWVPADPRPADELPTLHWRTCAEVDRARAGPASAAGCPA